MQGKEINLWGCPVSGWIYLDTLFDAIESELGIPGKTAWRILQDPIKNNEIKARISSDFLNNMSDLFPGMSLHQNWLTSETLDETWRWLTPEGWKNANLKAGKIYGCPVYVWWEDIDWALISASGLLQPHPEQPRSKGGRPPSYDWEAFWIEVVHYAAKNALDKMHRPELQQHMEKWTAEKWRNSPDQATIRNKLGPLYK